MSTPPKPASALAAPRGNLYRAAIVGAASFKGKEVAEMLTERNFPAIDVRLLDDDESLGQLEAMGDEISFIQAVRSEQFDNVDFASFASDIASTRKSWKQARDAGSAIIDLSSALEDEPGATVKLAVVGAGARAGLAARFAAGTMCRRTSGSRKLGLAVVARTQGRSGSPCHSHGL